MFHVVDFTAHLPRERTVVPDIWLSINNSLCTVPPPSVTSKELEELAKNRADPGEGWQLYGVSSLQTFESYSEAKDHLEKTKEESTPSEDGSRRKRKKPSYLVNYTSLDSDEGQTLLPDAPTITIKEEYEELDESSDPEWVQPDLVLTPVPRNDKSSSGSTAKKPRFQHSSSSEKFATDARCACNSSCHKAILQLLLSIQKQIEMNTRMLHQLLGYQAPPITTMQSLPRTFPVSLPVTEIEGLEEMDVFLQDDTNFAQTLSFFTALGGNDFKQTLRRILEKLLSTELAQQLNWKGRGEKKPFHTFQRIHSLIYHAAKQNPKCDTITLTDVEKFIKDWLRFAPDRYGGRLKKKLEAQEKMAAKDTADSET